MFIAGDILNVIYCIIYKYTKQTNYIEIESEYE